MDLSAASAFMAGHARRAGPAELGLLIGDPVSTVTGALAALAGYRNLTAASAGPRA